LKIDGYKNVTILKTINVFDFRTFTILFFFRSTELRKLIYAGRLCLFLLSGNRCGVHQLRQGLYTYQAKKSIPINLQQKAPTNAIKRKENTNKVGQNNCWCLAFSKGLFMLRRLSHLLVLNVLAIS